jgi:uncharacterized Ntn-hydrolase superfamily protein
MTYSLVACDLDARQWGVATQSKFLGVGSIVPWAEAEVGAVATQSFANPQYGPHGLQLLREGLAATDVVERLTTADEGRAKRQLGIVDAQGRAATFTGEECHDWAGGVTGEGYAAQGNILVSEATVVALAETFEGARGAPLAERLLAALQAAQAAGGDRRGQQSAAILVVEKDAGYAGLTDVILDLRVDDHARPIDELQRLHGVHETLFGKTAEWVPLDASLREEVELRLGMIGYATLADWAGVENLEERVTRDDAIDAVVLRELRARAG